MSKKQAKRVLSPAQARAVARMIDRELETKRISLHSNGTIAVTGTLTLISNIAQGVTNITRVGEYVRLKRLLLNWRVNAPSGGLFTAADNYNNVRIVVFRWKLSDAAVSPAIGNILEPTATDPTVALYNFDQAERFQVLYDKRVTVFNTAVYNGSGIDTRPGPDHSKVNEKPIYVGLNNMPIEFEGNTATGTGQIYLLMVSDSAFSPHPAVAVEAAIEYIDG